MDDATTVPESIDDAPEYEEPIEEAIERLADMSPVEYERARKDEAAKLGISRISVLDKLVESARPKETKNGQGRAINLPEPEPWPEKVDGGDLLDQIVRNLCRFLALSEGTAEAIALWCLHTHCLDATTISPRLAITSPEKQCGKTTALQLIEWLACRPLSAANITAAAVFRTIEAAHPTLLLDEADTFMDASDELRGILNSGHSRATAFVIRTTGDDHEPRQFATWGAVALAAIGKLPGTLEDRSIPVHMRRARLEDRIERLRPQHRAIFDPLVSMAARWAADNRTALSEADPPVPESLQNRPADNWRPLLAIAEIAGGDWPQRARRVAVTLSIGAEETSIRTLLLSDIRDIIDGRDRITSAELANSLAEMEDRPWPEWRQGKPITANKIARLLKPFAVAPTTIKLSSGSTAKGYTKEGLNDAFSRYLPPQPSNRNQSQNSAGFDEFPTVTQGAKVTVGKSPKTAENSQRLRFDGLNPGNGDVDTVSAANCVHCGQPIEPDQETVPHRDGELHGHCYSDWAESVSAGENWSIDL